MPASRTLKTRTTSTPSRVNRHKKPKKFTGDLYDAPPEPSTSALLSQSLETTEEWYKSKRTKKGYANYLKAGKKWLEDWTSEAREDSDDDSDFGAPNLKGAFDSITEYTPIALRLLVAFKCDHNGLGFTTAEGIRSAFKDYFER